MVPTSPEPLPTMAEIVAYSRRQAMDWSLALASQGIECTIERSAERERWLLVVPPHELERARETIRLYRAENRGWAWRKALPDADLELHWGAIVFCVVLALIHSLAAYELPLMEARGIRDNLKIHNGEWWRLFTAVFLHNDLGHLASNISFGILILGLAMGRFGAGLALLFTFLAGMIGNLAGYALYGTRSSGLGSSGMMMGALGMLAVHSIHLWRTNPRAARVVLSGVSAGVFIFIMFGVNPSSDVLAHFTGFVAGILFGAILALAPVKMARHRAVDHLALFFFVTISALVWILALR